MSFTFYSKIGSPIAYTEDACHIFLFTGKPVAYIDEDSIYNYNGKHLGFFEDGWIEDHDGFYLFFTKTATGGPDRAMQDIGPVKSEKSKIPDKNTKEPKPKKTENKETWSDLKWQQFFV
ncbi:hypothetical protein LCGC14_0766200 [marine sediment metagenome]|uniref:4-fold beta flower domain-containing protein n=1 Tax=marine sediment metagenome TaxID=412755 RepID=A0A0F9Q3X7_9ZZZZ|nr:hypothetical protein [bacterium]